MQPIYYPLSSLVNTLTCITISFLLYKKGKKRKEVRKVSFFTLCIGIWSIKALDPKICTSGYCEIYNLSGIK